MPSPLYRIQKDDLIIFISSTEFPCVHKSTVIPDYHKEAGKLGLLTKRDKVGGGGGGGGDSTDVEICFDEHIQRIESINIRETMTAASPVLEEKHVLVCGWTDRWHRAPQAFADQMKTLSSEMAVSSSITFQHVLGIDDFAELMETLVG